MIRIFNKPGLTYQIAIASMLCPICGCEGKRISGLRRTRKQEYFRCRSCKSLFSIRVATDKELVDFYNSYYNESNLNIPKVARESLHSRVSKFSKYRTSLNSLCDIGFGAGALLDAAGHAGWQCFGSEFSPDSILIGHSKGWTVHQGDLSSEDLVGPFDVVTIVETLEHVQSPNRILIHAKDRLREGGLVFGTTPNSESLNARILGGRWSLITFPEHPILLSTRAIQLLLENLGFENIKVKSQGFNPYDLIQLLQGFQKTPKKVESELPGRVAFGYTLIGAFTINSPMRILKRLISEVLALLRAGDTLVFEATKTQVK